MFIARNFYSLGLATNEQMSEALKRFSAAAPTSGSGLGVSIVEAIVKGHNGSMEIHSDQPGLRVKLILPIGTPAQ